MSENYLPTVDDVDLSAIPDIKLGRIAVTQLLDGFSIIPEEQRSEMLSKMEQNRAAFQANVLRSLFTSSHSPEKDGRQMIYLLGMGEAIVDTVLKSLRKIYPSDKS